MKNRKLMAGIMAGVIAAGAMQVSVFADAAKEYNGNDVSEHVDLTFYYVGNDYGDEQMIYDKINEVLEDKINATVTFKKMSLSDYSTNYSLLLAGGENVDLIYTSGWCFYNEEAGKGAFTEITDDMITQYMPLTKESQAEASYEQGMVDGKLYYVPACKIGYGHPNIVIRGDLREKYGIDELKTIDDLYTYMSAVAADKESGVTYAYNAAMNGVQLESLLCTTADELVKVADNFYYKYEDKEITGDDIKFLYETDEFKEYAQKMNEWAKEGFWSMSSINNQTDVRESFLNGTSAVYVQNLGSCGSVASSVVKTNPEWKPEVYDLNIDKVSLIAYDSDGYAVPYTSENPERALMALDIMKNDPDLYVIERYGIPGYHIELNDDGTWSQGEHYGTWSYGAAISWGLKNSQLEMNQDTIFPTELEILNKYKEISVESPTVGFAFSTTNVADSWANLTEVYTQYAPLLQLGLVDDIDGWTEDFIDNANNAGLEEIKEEIAAQLNAYNEAHQK